MPEFVSYTPKNRYNVMVIYVDHGMYIKDIPKDPVTGNLSPVAGRNFRLIGLRLDGVGDPIKYSIVIPQDLTGSFKLPQAGDIVTIQENYREPGTPPTYEFSMYSDAPLDSYTAAPIPQWGGLPGDYGHIRTYRDHATQFSPKSSRSFVKRYIKSITGYRFRSFYGNVYGTKERFLDRGKFVVRGDNVFDIQKGNSLMSEPVINSESGVDILPGVKTKTSLTNDLSEFPNPLNVPKKRELDDNYQFSAVVPFYPSSQIDNDVYKRDGNVDLTTGRDLFVTKHKVKNYLSYQPIVDKKYFEYIESSNPNELEESRREYVERELPAAEEYQVTLKGNNKLLIQDQYGDGEQLLITLKNQYDSGFTIVHNGENSQVRIRDHLGQGVLLDGNPTSPRVISWTTERQFIDMGSIREVDTSTGDVNTFGEYVYIRNGSVYGKSDTSFGRFSTEIPRDGTTSKPVPQQEFALVNAKNESNLSKMLDGLSSRLSEGMHDLLTESMGNGLFFRNNYDPKQTDQSFSVFNDFSTQPVLTTRMYQKHAAALNGKLIYSDFKQVVDNTKSETTVDNWHQEGAVTTRFNQVATSGPDDVTESRSYFYQDGAILANFESITTGDATSSEEQIAAVVSAPSGIFVSSRGTRANDSEARTQDTNMVLGRSMTETMRSAKLTGDAEEVRRFQDLLTLNDIELRTSTFTPSTKITQKKEDKIVNTWEITDASITSTQYFGDTEKVNSKVEQLQGSVVTTQYLNDSENIYSTVTQDQGNIIYQLNNDANQKISTVTQAQEETSLLFYNPADTESSKIIQQASGVDIERLKAGLTINIANDNQSGTVNVGSVSSTLNLVGTAIEVTGSTSVVVTSPSVDFNPA